MATSHLTCHIINKCTLRLAHLSGTRVEGKHGAVRAPAALPDSAQSRVAVVVPGAVQADGGRGGRPPSLSDAVPFGQGNSCGACMRLPRPARGGRVGAGGGARAVAADVRLLLQTLPVLQGQDASRVG